MSGPIHHTDAPAQDPAPAAERVLQAIMFTDIEGSVSLDQALGTERYARVLTRHGELFYESLAAVGAGIVEKHTGDGFMVRFTRPSDAVGAALRFQWLLRNEDWGIGQPLRVRIGIHQGEILLLPSEKTMPGTIGAPVNLAARVMSMAEGGQVLLTHAVFDDARQFVKTVPDVPAPEQTALGWEAHGAYRVKGIEEPVEIFEVGERGCGPFRQPKNGPGVERSVSKEEEAMLGWRPAPGLEIPRRAGWIVARKLGEGGFGEVWLAENRKTMERRVFKFCFDAVRLRSFKREVMLFQLIREALGPRRDIATLYEVQLEASPFFLESEFCAGGTLADWITARMADGGAPLAQRLELVARIARALAAAHSVGIIHKDVKPSNIFIDEAPDGSVHPRLADFGIGVLADRSAVDGLELSFTGTLTATPDASRTGTRMYGAPEYMVGLPPSILGDIYSLGVLLYQVVAGDFRRPLAPGWRRDVPDALLVEDIAVCVDVDPARRPSSALLVAEKLETLEGRRAALAEAAAAVQREQELQRQMAAQRRRVRVALVSAVIAVLVIGALGVAVIVLHRARVAEIAHSQEIAAQRETARDHLYISDMQAATDDMVNWRAEAAREMINRHRPGTGERDRRGWEWYFADSVLNSGELVRAVSTKPLRAMAVSPDEKSVAVAGDDGEVSVWSCATFEKAQSWRSGAVRSLGWSGAGVLATGLANGEVVLWEAASGREQKRWKAHEGAVSALGWQPEKGLLATGGADGVLAWWHADGRAAAPQVRKHGPVLALDWRADGGEFAAVLGSPARLVAGALDALDHESALRVEESAVAWRPGAHEVAVAMDGAPMKSWDPYQTITTFYLPGEFSSGASAYAWSPGGESVAVGGIDGKIVVFNSSNPRGTCLPFYGHAHRVTALRWLGGARERLLSIGEDGTLRAWDELRRSRQITSGTFPIPPTDAKWHPTDNRLAVLLAGDEVQVLAGDTGSPVWGRPMPAPRRPRAPFTGGSLAWSPDGRWLAAACAGRGVVAWRVDGTEKFAPAEFEDASDVQWMPDSQRLLVRTARGWFTVALVGGKSALVADEHAIWAGGLDDDRIGAVAPVDGALHFLVTNPGAKTPAIKVAVPVELGAVRCCALSANRALLAIGGNTGAVVWIDTQTGQPRQPPVAHSGPIQAMGWHPGGLRLVTAGADGTCRIFNIGQATQSWVVEHKLPSEIVAAGWSGDGGRLMLASAPGRQMKIFDASHSLLRWGNPASKGGGTPAAPTASEGVARACALIERHPDEEAGWQSLAREVKGSNDANARVLLAAAELGESARFSFANAPALENQTAATTCQGVALPRAVQVAQACALGRWEEVAALSAGRENDAGAGWLALARAEALTHLGRHREAEAANMEAWEALRRHHGGSEPATARGSDRTPGVDLTPWANTKLTEDWTGGENDNLRELPATIPQAGGVTFHCRDFIQLAGKSFRISMGRMLPRSTGWMPLGSPAGEVNFAVSASATAAEEWLGDTCIGSIFLRRADGGAVRIPLIYGRNVWDWWVPSGGHVSEAPPDAVAWRGWNPRAGYYEHRLALYRIRWAAESGGSPIVAVSMVSTLRRPAPLLVAADAKP